MARYYRRGETYPLDALARLLAKSNIGRFEWVAYKSMKESCRLVPEDLGDWTVAQKMFVYWSTFYDSVYESVDRPPDRVIEDDSKLEVWLKSQKKKAEAYSEENWGKSQQGAIKDVKSAWDHQEVIQFGQD